MFDTSNHSPEAVELAKQRVAERERCKVDKMYLAEVLGYDFQPDVHQELFDQFISYDETKPWAQQAEKTKRLILWPRGHFKTYAVHVAVIQAIINFPNIRILLMQFGLKNTQKLMKAIRAHFLGTAEGSRFRELFPEFCSKKLGNAKELEATPMGFTVTARTKRQLPQPTVECASAKSGKTGQHYDIAFVDDLICDQNYKSDVQLAKAEEDFHMAMPLLDPPFYVVVTGTRYAFGDLYEKIIRADSVDHKWVISVKNCWTDDGKEVRFTQRETVDGRLIGFTRELLLDIAAKTPGIFASQYLNQPIAESDQLFTEPMMVQACLTADKVPALGSITLFVDLASTDASYSDDSVIYAGAKDYVGRMYTVDVSGGKWKTHDFAMNVIAMAMKHRPVRIMFEKTASAHYFVDYLKVVAGQKGIILPIDYLKADVRADAKNIRISALQGHIRNKRFFFLSGIPCWDKIVKQFTQFDPNKKKRHNDYPDTAALMAVYFTSEAATNPVSIAANRVTMLDVIQRLTERSVMKNVLEDRKEPSYDEMGSDFGC